VVRLIKKNNKTKKTTTTRNKGKQTDRNYLDFALESNFAIQLKHSQTNNIQNIIF